MAKKYSAKTQVVILWESEIRNAALALKLLSDAPKDLSDADFSKLLRDAINACNAALHGAQDENSLLILSKPDSVFKLS